MDSIEIEGKEYVSAKRASREHRYTMDYVGQLIRAGKIEGKKVGRAWYVDQASLEAYTRTLGSTSEAPSPRKIAVSEAAPSAPVIRQVEAPAHRIEIKAVESAAAEAVAVGPMVQEVVTAHVEVKKQPEPVYEAPKPYLKPARESLDEVFSMRYLEDSEPTLPSISERKEERAIHQQIAVRTLQSDAYQKLQRPEVEVEEETRYVPTPQRRASSRGFGSTLRVAAGVVVIVFVLSLAAGSIFVDRTWQFDGTAVTAGVSFSQGALGK